ncbi:MAG: hypothetical protein COA96_09600 [SAR86 cluster bacterium]|uniref:DUF1249 domain-containing protein n=1 Tax=SAR86 cluster bacterium TaxID=2030880 RepID=A0A2A5AZX3_9GAMM|nr:MAG: hypothetical protein COA96_09600 [SAR86 cluster bacterium]
MPKRNYSIDLIKQMAECDANYIRLLKLVPQLQAYRNSTFADFVLPGNSMRDNAEIEKIKNSSEPEKLLEGLSVEFCIADMEDGEGKVTVEIRIVEAFKYTTTLEIKQKPLFKQWMTDPTMLVRVYHDASTAEVTSYQGHKNLKPRYDHQNSKMYHVDEKMQVNKFLGEWLTHSLKVGRSTKTPEILLNT